MKQPVVIASFFGLAVFVAFLGACNVLPPVPPGGGGGTTPDQALSNADTVRGGTMYDKFWKVQGVTAAEPTTDHPLWAMRPDQTSNTRSGADTWRCKECHGWDYKGVDGVYGASTSSHRTGIGGILDTTMSGEAIFDLLKNDHAYAGAGLSDDDIWDLTKFVLQGLIDTDPIINATGAFTGSETAGEMTYDTSCLACHGQDGRTLDFGGGEFVGTVATENPWEFQHKVRFGQPGVAGMPAQLNVLSDTGVSDLGAFAQTLPPEASGSVTGDAVAGQAFFEGNNAGSLNCTACHCADASGGCLLDAPSLAGVASAEVFDHLSGFEPHTGGTVAGVTQQDTDDVAAWLASL